MTTKKTQFRWLIVGLLFLITMLNYIDRSSIAYAVAIIGPEFKLSPAQLGWILGIFGIGYCFSTFLGGLAADHFGAKRTLLWATTGWVLATLLLGVANGFYLLLFARALLGLAEGPNFPGMTRALSDWLPENERNVSLSLALIAVPFALAIGGPIVSILISYTSWRMTYVILAGSTLVWIPIWLYCFCDKPVDSCQVNAAELLHIQDNTIDPQPKTTPHQLWPMLLGNRTLLANYWAFFVFGFYLFFFMTWLPEYLHQTYHFTIMKSAMFTFFPWLLAAILMGCVGYIADRIYQRTKNLRWSRTYPILISQVLAELCIVAIIYTHRADIAMLFIALAIGFSMSANAAYYAVNIDIVKARAGTALGIMEAVLALAGFCAPTLTGYIVLYSGHFETIFWVLIGLGVCANITTILFHNRTKSV